MSPPHVMSSALLTVLCVCLCPQAVFCQYQETCTTLEGGIGTCTPTILCAPYFNLLGVAKNLTISFQLRDAQCGSHGINIMVCCPNQNEPPPETSKLLLTLNTSDDSNKDQGITQLDETCTTIEGGVGKCESLAACEPYLHLTRQAKNIPLAIQLRDAQCGSDGNDQKVCCPTSGTSTSSPTGEPSFRSLSESDYITAFPEPPDCGFSLAHFNRVVGGVNAKLGDFPWMALLGTKQGNWDAARWICGGTLISHRHVLTAAHCIKNELNVVRLGELDFERDDDGASPIDFSIKRKIKHENFDYASFTNDIGLLILGKDVEFTRLMRPICLPTREDLRSKSFVGYHPFIAGWGNVDNRGAAKSHMQVAQLPVLENSKCRRVYELRVIDERVMCAGVTGKDSCNGDSGGPLMQPNTNRTTGKIYFYQTGVVSYGHTRCGEASFPGVYSSVQHFLPWIQKHVLGSDE
nr:venom serine protease Bi-VSP-like [Danaus plexippus plexippus]